MGGGAGGLARVVLLELSLLFHFHSSSCCVLLISVVFAFTCLSKFAFQVVIFFRFFKLMPGRHWEIALEKRVLVGPSREYFLICFPLFLLSFC